MKLAGVRLGACGLAAVVVAAAAAAAPRWHVISGASVDNEAVIWESGRLWFLNSTGNGRYILRSAGVARGRLSGWKQAAPKLEPGGWVYRRSQGRDLVFASSATGANARLVAVRLMPNGTLGDPVDVGGAPMPPSSTAATFAQLRDRAVLITGVTSSRSEFAGHIAVCCDVNGKVANFQRFPGSRNAMGRLGVDHKGRLWMAWVPGRQGVKQRVRVVELEPDTLKARGQPMVVPGFGGFLTLRAMICTDVCRVFLEGLAARGKKVGSWAPGERTLTSIRIPQRTRCPSGSCAGLIDARAAGTGLALAYSADASQSGYTIGTARADSRGRLLRRVSSIREPSSLGPIERSLVLSSIPFGAMGPDGFAAIAAYSGSGRPIVRVAFLPLH